MGCTTTKRLIINKDFPGQDSDSYRDMLELGFSREDIDGLYTSFCKFDLEHSGEIDIAEFTERLNIGINKISNGVFGDIDIDMDKSINFKEVSIIHPHCVRLFIIYFISLS